MKLANDLTPQL